LCSLLGINLPIAQAPIGSATTPELVAAVSNAGGLGSLALSWRDSAEVRAVLRRTRELTSRPFAANLVLEWPQEERLQICLEQGVRIISTFWGDPSPIMELAHNAGAVVIHAVGSVAEAVTAAGAGVDVVVAQGVEAGGHVRGREQIHRLLSSVLDAVASTPVFAAGGVADVEDAAALFKLGADGVWVGTRFLCSEEAGVDRSYQEAILKAREGDTILTKLFTKGWEDAPHGVLTNSTVRAWLDAGEPPVGGRPGEQDVVAEDPGGRAIERYSDVIPVRGSRGNLEALALYAGVGAAKISTILPASDIITELAGTGRRPAAQRVV